MPIEDAFHSITKIIEDMEAVGNMHCLRSAARCSLSIGGTPIPRHDLDGGVGLQPLRQAGSRPIWEQIHGSALLGIDQDGAIGVPSPLAPVVHPQHAW
jgi:hypothetical protein